MEGNMADEVFIESDLFRTFAFYTVVLLLKILSNNALTVYYRTTRKSYRVPEDFALKKLPNQSYSHPDVDRAVRIHEHDLENIVPFILIGAIYILTGPSVTLASWYFRLFTCARLVHTVAYLKALQPHRTVAHVLATAVLFAMTISSLLHFLW